MKQIGAILMIFAILACLCACEETAMPQPVVSVPAQTETPEEASEEATTKKGTPSAVKTGNPWQDVTSDELKAAFGRTFGVPEKAEGVSFQWNASGGMAQMQFTFDGIVWTARMQNADRITDISGMSYPWNEAVATEEEIQYAGRSGEFTMVSPDETVKLSGELHFLNTDDGTAALGLWYHAAEKVMFSLSCVSEEEFFSVDHGMVGTVFFPEQKAVTSPSPSPSSTPSPKADSHTHSWVLSEETATCTQAGYRTYTCSCGAYYSEDESALGHSYQTQHCSATCTRAEGDLKTCSRCGNQIFEETAGGKPAQGHMLEYVPDYYDNRPTMGHITHCVTCDEYFPNTFHIHEMHGGPCYCGWNESVG